VAGSAKALAQPDRSSEAADPAALEAELPETPPCGCSGSQGQGACRL